MSDGPVIELRGIVTRFGSNLVHDGIDLSVARGEVVALVGGSGSGKTTLLRHMIGLTRPARGEVSLFGEQLFSGSLPVQRARRRRFGVLFQQGALFSALNVAENIGFPLRELRVVTPMEIRDLVALKLAMVELEPSTALLMPAELSGGMVKRVALARALALEPELLLLDEPTAGLDPDRSAAFVELVRSLQAQLGLTVVLVTHDIDTLAALSSKVAILAERRIISYAPLEETMELDHPFVASFFRGELGRRAIARSRGET
ncbi:ABC transporter ATP-binding protein [Aromatoleum aromaticum]|uniref:ATPase component, ABC-type transport system n=1 Tax=Aromatoleum aromaticum (strain DSM 19018 / LMG 30748 / EbN1) TaxID=76114 RepID=Q5NYL2_AROAE|nr:ATP-binding cassette domain-containing protein [Aromatoleum aromaticum]NMG53376.1 ATP-binding cassette domain-containing protein [Aromatoleum aromaticum]CAI09852.1 ATPase component, ABC-type transport system [Aromatoleum aromaticum EbN1]